MYDFAVFIGRFQIFHSKHEEIVRLGLQKAQHVILILGSHDSPRTVRNPFTSYERELMIRGCFTVKENLRITVLRICDYLYNDGDWITDVQESVRSVIGSYTKICLLGTHKDQTSRYLDYFPEWKREFTADTPQLNATDLREEMYNVGNIRRFSGISVNPMVAEWVESWVSENSEKFNNLVKERAYLCKYKEMWEDAPFPVTFVTTDAVVVKNGYVLLIRRGHNPGKGLWAFPGGFLDQTTTLEENAIKELKEETKISVPKHELAKHIKEVKTFDHPQRSERGRTITTAFLFDLRKMPDGLPAVKGADDADEARWFRMADVYTMRSVMYEDHFHMFNYFHGRL